MSKRQFALVACVAIVGCSVAAAALFATRQPRLARNPPLQPGQTYGTFAVVRSNVYPNPDGEYHYEVTYLVDDLGVVRVVPEAWREPMRHVVAGEVVSLPPTWRLWQATSAPDIAERLPVFAAWRVSTASGQKVVRAATIFHAPAP